MHHSTEVAAGITTDRTHPADDVVDCAWDGLITGPRHGFQLFFTLDPVELTSLDISVYVLRNSSMMGFVRHTLPKISFGPLVIQIIRARTAAGCITAPSRNILTETLD